MEFSKMSPLKYMFYILRHPIDGFQELKWNNKGSLRLANILIFIWYVTTAINHQYEGFIFNSQDPDKINLIMIFIGTVMVFAIAVLANWSFSTLMDGEGTLKDIWIAGSYTLIPLIASIFIRTLLSRILIFDEEVFLKYIVLIGMLWTSILIFCAVMVTHDFTPAKTVTLLLFTLLGMFAVLFLIILLYGLFNQVLMFVVNIYYELLSRFTTGGGV